MPSDEQHVNAFARPDVMHDASQPASLPSRTVRLYTALTRLTGLPLYFISLMLLRHSLHAIYNPPTPMISSVRVSLTHPGRGPPSRPRIDKDTKGHTSGRKNWTIGFDIGRGRVGGESALRFEHVSLAPDACADT